MECPPRSDVRLAILREVWAAVRKCADLHAYLRCADAWSEYVIANFGSAELDALLRDAVKHLEVGTAAGVEAARAGRRGCRRKSSRWWRASRFGC